jgi:hypothetical protein
MLLEFLLPTVTVGSGWWSSLLASHAALSHFLVMGLLSASGLTSFSPPPDSRLYRLWPSPLVMTTDAFRSFLVLFAIWHAIFFVDYFVYTCVEWLAVVLFFLLFDLRRALRIVFLLVLSYALTYVVPAWWISFAASLALNWAVATLHSKYSNPQIRAYEMADLYRNVQPCWWLFAIINVYRDIWWRQHPSTLLTFGIFTVIAVALHWPNMLATMAQDRLETVQKLAEKRLRREQEAAERDEQQETPKEHDDENEDGDEKDDENDDDEGLFSDDVENYLQMIIQQQQQQQEQQQEQQQLPPSSTSTPRRQSLNGSHQMSSSFNDNDGDNYPTLETNNQRVFLYTQTLTDTTHSDLDSDKNVQSKTQWDDVD